MLLCPDGISRVLLNKAGSALELTGSVGHALDVLTAASLVTWGGAPGDDGRDGVVVTVHRLTARVIRHQAVQPHAVVALSEAITATIGLLDALTDDLPDWQVALRRAEADEIIGHILAVRGHLPNPQPRLLSLSEWVGWVLTEAGDLTRATTVLRANVADRIDTLGADHPDTLAGRHHLAVAYRMSGRDEDAVGLLQEVITDRVRVLGAHHIDTLNSRQNLAFALMDAGRIDEATELTKDVLADRARALGADHPHTLASRNNLAEAYLHMGRADEAIGLCEETISRQERVLGLNHLGTFTSRATLATAHLAAGRVDRAIHLFEQVLADSERVFSPNHRWIAGVREELAAARRLQAKAAGRPTQA